MIAKENSGFELGESLGFLLSKCHQKAFQIFREKLLPYNLTPPQFAVLALLWKKDGLSQIQLGTVLEMDRTTISGVIDRLTNQELVHRMPYPEDRRVFIINLTEAGQSLEQSMTCLSHQANTEAAANLSDREKETLVFLLNKMRGECI